MTLKSLAGFLFSYFVWQLHLRTINSKKAMYVPGRITHIIGPQININMPTLRYSRFSKFNRISLKPSENRKIKNPIIPQLKPIHTSVSMLFVTSFDF